MSLLDQLLGRSPTPSLDEIWNRRDTEHLAREISLPSERTTLADSRRPKSVVGYALDLLSRGEYASASLANSLFNEDNVSFATALAQAAGEIVTPEQRLNYADVIKRANPELAARRPLLTGVISLAASIAFDPLNFIPMRHLAVLKHVGKFSGDVLALNATRAGREAVSQVWRRVSDSPLFQAGEEAVEAVGGRKELLWDRSVTESLRPSLSPSMSSPVPETFHQAIMDLARPVEEVTQAVTRRERPPAIWDHPLFQEELGRQTNQLRGRLQDELDVSLELAEAAAREPTLLGTTTRVPRERQGERLLAVGDYLAAKGLDDKSAQEITALAAQAPTPKEGRLLLEAAVVVKRLGRQFKPGTNSSSQILRERAARMIASGQALRAGKAAMKELPTDLSGWGVFALDGSRLDEAVLWEGKVDANRLFGAERVYPLNGETVEGLPLFGTLPAVALVPPLLQRGNKLSPGTTLDDLIYFVGDQAPVQGRDAIQAAKRAKAGWDPARAAVKEAYKELDEAVLRFERSNLLKGALDEMGLKADDLIDQGGLKVLGKTVITDKNLSRFFDVMGVNHAAKWVSSLPGVDQIGKVWGSLQKKFSVDAEMRGILEASGLSGHALDRAFAEFMRWRSAVEARFLKGAEKSQQLAVAFGKMLKDEGSERRVLEVMQATQDDVRRFLDAQALENSLTGAGEVPKVMPSIMPDQEVRMIWANAKRAQLNEGEQGFLAALISKKREMAEIQAEAGMIGAQLISYTPLRWRMSHPGAIGRGFKNMLATRRAVVDPLLRTLDGKPTAGTAGLDQILTGADRHLFALSKHAEAAGWEPIYDVVNTVGMEFIQHAQARIMHDYQQGMRALMPDLFKQADAGFQSAKAAIKTMEGHLFRTMRHEPGLPDGSEALRLSVKALDAFNGFFKKAATIWNPAFIMKNLIGDLGLVAARGTTALGVGQLDRPGLRKVFDPTAYSAALMTIFRGKAPQAIEDAFGNQHTAEMVAGYLSEWPVMKNMTVEGIAPAGQSFRSLKQARQEVNKARALGAFGDGRLPSARGLADLAARSFSYVDVPGKTTDLVRLSTFYNYLSHGHAPGKAFELMERSLFNYTSGLTRFEEATMARIIPFYRFTKFSTALTLNVVATAPRNIENLHKVARTIGDAWAKIEATVFNGDRDTEPMTDAERGSLGGWLFEQPHAFAGVDPVLKEAAFRTFNGLSFLDWMGMLQLNEYGEMDAERTAVSGGLAQMAPFIKMPLEWVFSREFFTEAALGPDGRNVGPVDPEKFFRALTIHVASAATPSVGGVALGVGAGEMLARLGAPGALRQILGWEEAVDPRDGQRKVYVNPYMLQIGANIFPPLRTALAVSREDRHPAENVMRLFMGTGTIKLDLLEQANYRRRELNGRVDEDLSRLRKVLREGRTGTRTEADIRADLQESISILQDEARLLTSSQVRGRGL